MTVFTGQEIRTAWAQVATFAPLPAGLDSTELVKAVRAVPELAMDSAVAEARACFMAHLVVNRLIGPHMITGRRGLHADMVIIDEEMPTGRLTPPVEPIHIPGKPEWYGPDEMTPDGGSKSDDTEGHQRG